MLQSKTKLYAATLQEGTPACMWETVATEQHIIFRVYAATKSETKLYAATLKEETSACMWETVAKEKHRIFRVYAVIHG